MWKSPLLRNSSWTYCPPSSNISRYLSLPLNSLTLPQNIEPNYSPLAMRLLLLHLFLFKVCLRNLSSMTEYPKQESTLIFTLLDFFRHNHLQVQMFSSVHLVLSWFSHMLFTSELKENTLKEHHSNIVAIIEFKSRESAWLRRNLP